MVFDQAQSPRLGQRVPVESTYVRMFAGAEIPEAAWEGQLIYRIDEQILQIYDGDAWEDITGGQVGQLTFVGPTVPVAQSVGDIWYDSSDSNRQYVAKSAGADQIVTGEWEVVSAAAPPITATTQIYQKNTAPGPSDVPPPKYADFWYQTPGNNQYYYDPAAPGNHWVFVQDAGIPAAQATADSKTTNFVTSGTIPTSLAIGDTWVNKADNSKLYVARVVGANTIAIGQWELSQDWFTANTTAGNAAATAAVKVQSFYQISPPTANTAGDIWFDTDDGYKQYRASGAGANHVDVSPNLGWYLVQDSLIPTAVATANGKNTIYYDTAQPMVPANGALAFTENDLWFDTDNGYAISIFTLGAWTAAPYGGEAIDNGAITQREINTSYAYAGVLRADQITTGNISFGIGIAALLRTPGNQGDPGVEIDPTGIKIIGTTDDTTTTLQPGLSVFKGSAEVTTLVVKGAVDGTAATLRQSNQIARGAKLIMSNGVTPPSAAPVPAIDWASVPLTGYGALTSNQAFAKDLQWDASVSRWMVTVAATNFSTGDNVGRMLMFKADGTFDAQVGVDLTAGAGSVLAGVRIPGVDNWYLWTPGDGSFYLSNAAGTSIRFYPQSVSSTFSMAYDGSNLIIGENRIGTSSSFIHLFRFTTSAISGPNLVVNNDFEVNTTGWTPSAGSSVSRYTISPIFGTGSLSWQAVANSTLTNAQFNVTPAMAYEVLFWVKTQAGSSNVQVKLDVLWYNAGGTLIQTDLSSSVMSAVAAVQYGGSRPLVAPPTAAKAALRYTATGAGTIVIDTLLARTVSGLQSVASVSELEVTSTVPTVNGLYVGNGDFGSKQWVIASAGTVQNQATVVPDSSMVENNQAWFPLPPQTPVGIGYDGTSFWTLGANNTLYKYEGGNNYGAGAGTWWAGSTYQDTVNGFETSLSSIVQITMGRRQRLTLTTAPLISTGSGDPNAVGVYLGQGSTLPASSSMHYQGSAVANKVVVTAADFAAAAPSPVAFPASSPAEFRSTVQDSTGPLITFKGDGSGRIGQASWDTSGNWVGIGGGGSGGTTLDTYTAIASAATTLTTGGVGLTGCSVPISVGATTDRFLVNAAVDIQMTVTGTATAAVDLTIDGTNAGGEAIYAQPGATAGARSTISQNWIVTGMSAGTHTLALLGAVTTGTGTWRANQLHTRFTVVKLVGVKGDTGAKGDKGDTGLTGSTGATGLTGPTGATGSIGPAGSTGPQGVKGDPGIQGIQGTTGSTGAQGTPGEVWFSGAGAPASGTGIVGDWDLDTTSGDIYEKTTSTIWTLRGNIRGPQGMTGSTGATGAQGPQGNDGTPGTPGATGAAGTPGATGAQGPKGDKGDTGLTGPAGPSGSGAGDVTGPTGAVGDNITVFNATTGKLLKDGGASIAQVRDRSTHTGTQAAATITGLPTALPPNGAAGGDLGGTYPNPTVPGLAGKAATVHTHVKADVTDFAHTHPIGDLPVAPSGTSNTTQLVRADDARLSNSRTPAAHAASHGSGQSDAVTLAESQITNLVTDLAAKAASVHTHAAADVTSGALAVDRLGTSPASGLYLRGAASGGTGAWSNAATVKTDLALQNVPNVDTTNAANLSSGLAPVDRLGSSPAATTYLRGSGSGGTGSWQNVAGIKSDLALTKGDVGLGNVDNTSDVNKPVSTAQAAAVLAAQNNAAPTGCIQMWGGPSTAVPSGWWICQGGAISRTTYANLFAVIGTLYGAGDGSTTFNLPNMMATFPMGVPFGTTNPGGTGGTAVTDIVNHTHTTPNHQHPFDLGNTAGSSNSVLAKATTTVSTPGAVGPYNPGSSGSGATSNPNQTSVATGENRPPFMQVHFIIKA